MSAREYFGEVLRASEEVEQCQRVINELADGLPPRHGGGAVRASGTSDPVYAAFITRTIRLAEARATMDRDNLLIGEALALIDGLRRVFCRKADVLELRYVDRMSWSHVADELGVSVRTAYGWHKDVMAFVDETPRAYILGLRNNG